MRCNDFFIGRLEGQCGNLGREAPTQADIVEATIIQEPQHVISLPKNVRLTAYFTNPRSKFKVVSVLLVNNALCS